MLDLPGAADDLSPFEHPAQLPLEPFALGPVVTLAAVAVAAALLGLVAFCRRGINVA